MTNFPAFNKKEHRLDEFFFSAVKVQNHKNLAFILKIVLTLSHGQAAVQRGFSVSKAALDVNMQENSLIARKLIRVSYVIKQPKATMYGSAQPHDQSLHICMKVCR